MGYDYIIIGAGVMGSFHAYHALRNGKKVLLIDRNDSAHEASVRNFGQAVISGLALNEWHKYGRRAAEVYSDLHKKAALPIRRNGSYYVANTPGELRVIEEMALKFADLDYPCTLWDREDVLKNIPALNRDYVAGALVFPDEISIEPESMVLRLREYLVEQMGLEQKMNTLVREIRSHADHIEIVFSNGTKVEGGEVLLCNGRELQLLYPECFAEAGLEVCKLQMMSLKDPGQRLPGNILTGLSIRRYESFRYCKSWAELDNHGLSDEYDKLGIHILFKQRPDGTVILGDSHEYLDAAEAHNFGFYHSSHTDQLMLQEAKRIAGFSKWEVEFTWDGYYTQCKEADIYRYSPEPNVHIINGIGGKGMTTAAGFAAEFFEKN